MTEKSGRSLSVPAFDFIHQGQSSRTRTNMGIKSGFPLAHSHIRFCCPQKCFSIALKNTLLSVLQLVILQKKVSVKEPEQLFALSDRDLEKL